jgi:DNA-binding SARP family transcriptional activator
MTAAMSETAETKLIALVMRELMDAGLKGDALFEAIGRIEIGYTRVLRYVTGAGDSSKAIERMRRYRARKQEQMTVTAADVTRELMSSKLSASLGPRPHNPLGQKSGHIARRPDVTRTVMGDPEPGRSALDKRKG